MITFTLDEFYKALRDATDKHPEGWTTRELADLLGVSLNAASQRISECGRKGLVRFVGNKSDVNMIGKGCMRPAYIWVHNPCSQTPTKSTSPTRTRRR